MYALKLNVDESIIEKVFVELSKFPLSKLQIEDDGFTKTRDFFRESLSEIESGRAKLVDIKDGFDELDGFIDNLK